MVHSQELSSSVLTNEFEKILTKHKNLDPKQFNDDTLFKHCVSEVAPHFSSSVSLLRRMNRSFYTHIYVHLMTGCPSKGGPTEEAGMLHHASQVHVRFNYRLIACLWTQAGRST